MRFSFYFKQGNWFLVILIYTILLLGIIAFINFKFNNPYVTFGSIIVTLFFLFSSNLIFKRMYLLDFGLDGENAVRKELSNLPSSFYPLFDLQLGNKGNIDAVVIGPTGVWAIEVKSHKGNITFQNDQLLRNGSPLKNFLGQTYAEKKEVEEWILKTIGVSIFVNPVLVFSSTKARMKFGHAKQRGVYVIGKSWLLKLVQNENYADSLSPEQCTQIYAALKKFTSRF